MKMLVPFPLSLCPPSTTYLHTSEVCLGCDKYFAHVSSLKLDLAVSHPLFLCCKLKLNVKIFGLKEESAPYQCATGYTIVLNCCFQRKHRLKQTLSVDTTNESQGQAISIPYPFHPLYSPFNR